MVGQKCVFSYVADDGYLGEHFHDLEPDADVLGPLRHGAPRLSDELGRVKSEGSHTNSENKIIFAVCCRSCSVFSTDVRALKYCSARLNITNNKDLNIGIKV